MPSRVAPKSRSVIYNQINLMDLDFGGNSLEGKFPCSSIIMQD